MSIEGYKAAKEAAADGRLQTDTERIVNAILGVSEMLEAIHEELARLREAYQIQRGGTW